MSTERRLRARASRRRCAVIGEDGTHARRRRLERHADLRRALLDRRRPLRLLHHHSLGRSDRPSDNAIFVYLVRSDDATFLIPANSLAIGRQPEDDRKDFT